MSTSLFSEEDVIHRYTRAEAIEDGVLVDGSIGRSTREPFPAAHSFYSQRTQPASARPRR